MAQLTPEIIERIVKDCYDPDDTDRSNKETLEAIVSMAFDIDVYDVVPLIRKWRKERLDQLVQHNVMISLQYGNGKFGNEDNEES